jgi:hypothetical protein
MPAKAVKSLPRFLIPVISFLLFYILSLIPREGDMASLPGRGNRGYVKRRGNRGYDSRLLNSAQMSASFYEKDKEKIAFRRLAYLPVYCRVFGEYCAAAEGLKPPWFFGFWGWHRTEKKLADPTPAVVFSLPHSKKRRTM